jgi:hypothetical protein
VRRRPPATPARVLALALLGLGTLLLVASIFADQLELSGGGAGVGWKQLLGAIVGLVLLLVGLAWLLLPALGEGEEPLEPAEE